MALSLASQMISNSFPHLGAAMTGAEINFPFMLSNASKHSMLNSKTASFSNNLHKDYAILEKSLMKSFVKVSMALETPHTLDIRWWQ